MLKNRFFSLLFLTLLLLTSSCDSIKNVAYIQDAQYNNQTNINASEIRIAPDDLLSIMVNSSNPEIVIPFNMPLVSYQMTSNGVYAGGAQRVLGYIVDKKGEIDFPVLGKLKVAGLSRRELASMIKEKLYNGDLVKDAVVTVQFQNFKVSVMGEVNRPCTINVPTDRITIFEALSNAGDLTIYGRRDKVLVVRETNGKRITYIADLRDSGIFNSPAYYLQQNDVVYVEPNKVKAGQRNINQNRSVSTWVAVASLLTNIAILVINLTKK